MLKSIQNRGLMRPADIALLQRVFDASCSRREVDPESAEARDIALNIIALFDAGMTEEATLLDAVGFRLPLARSA